MSKSNVKMIDEYKDRTAVNIYQDRFEPLHFDHDVAMQVDAAAEKKEWDWLQPLPKDDFVYVSNEAKTLALASEAIENVRDMASDWSNETVRNLLVKKLKKWRQRKDKIDIITHSRERAATFLTVTLPVLDEDLFFGGVGQNTDMTPFYHDEYPPTSTAWTKCRENSWTSSSGANRPATHGSSSSSAYPQCATSIAPTRSSRGVWRGARPLLNTIRVWNSVKCS